jgi:GH25 family lysozyme M1 (1,4-beta-N-acetylmuramidase)
MRKVLALALSLALTAFTIVPVAADDLSLIGPGDRLHGADVSRWQHPNDKPINFKKMHSAGLSFVMIKASDTRYDADRLALKYVKMDRNAAQDAGIYTGFYH